MQWLNLEMSVLENEAFGCAETVDVGIWLRLTRYCCVQENNGRIRGAKEWDDRKWMFLCRLQKPEILRKSALWTWKNEDLVVHHFPLEKLRQVQRLRRQSSEAANSRWRKRDANRHADGMPSGNADHDSGTASRNAERKGKERKEKGKRRHLSHEASRPASLQEVVAFFATSNVPADSAEDFFNHFQANGWTQGGRPEAPLAAWQPEAQKWISRWRRDRVPQNSSGGGGAPAFDPKQPDAHTGGVPVHN